MYQKRFGLAVDLARTPNGLLWTSDLSPRRTGDGQRSIQLCLTISTQGI